MPQCESPRGLFMQTLKCVKVLGPVQLYGSRAAGGNTDVLQQHVGRSFSLAPGLVFLGGGCGKRGSSLLLESQEKTQGGKRAVMVSATRKRT